MHTYRILNKTTGQWRENKAPSAEEAAQIPGWFIENCYFWVKRPRGSWYGPIAPNSTTPTDVKPPQPGDRIVLKIKNAPRGSFQLKPNSKTPAGLESPQPPDKIVLEKKKAPKGTFQLEKVFCGKNSKVLGDQSPQRSLARQLFKTPKHQHGPGH
ncbi:hypothetical protein ES703_70114 [subsurface metagenome]